MFRQGPIVPFGYPNHHLYPCGDRYASRAETLILGGFAGLFGENGVVFLRKVRWIGFRLGGDGDNVGLFKNESL